MEKLLSANTKLEKLQKRVTGTNHKLQKVNGANYLITGLTLAPANISGHNVCQWKTPGCASACVMHFGGQRVTPLAREKAKRITRWLFADREGFEKQLRVDIAAHVRKCNRLKLLPAMRLNMGSDLNWEHIIAGFPDVTFYDYTKSVKRMRGYIAGELPDNYHLTYSDNERADPEFLRQILKAGANIARVFDIEYNPQWKKYGRLPATVTILGLTSKVIDGDLHDLRLPEIDGRGVVVGLRLKGTNKARAAGRRTGFAMAGV